MNGSMQKIMTCVAMGLMASLLSAETYTWCGGDGDWTTSANWKDSSGAVLTSGYPNATDAKIRFSQSGAVTVTLADSVDIFKLDITETASVTLGGGGFIVINAGGYDYTKASYVNGELTINDITVTHPALLYVYGKMTFNDGSSWMATAQPQQLFGPGSEMIVNGGRHYFRGLYMRATEAPYAKLTVNGGVIAGATDAGGRSDIYTGTGEKKSTYAGNQVIINGGSVTAWPVADPGTEWHVNGGALKFASVWAYGGTFYVHSGGIMEFSGHGGTDQKLEPVESFVFEPGSCLRWSTGLSLLPDSLRRSACTIDFAGENVTIGPTNTLGSATLCGTIIATNGASAGVSTAYEKARVEGRPTIIANRFQVPADKYGYADVKTLVLGRSLDITGSAEANFYGSIIFGSFGDWKHLGNSNSDTFFHGDVTVDTSDWFDTNAAPHHVSLNGVRPDLGLTLNVKGGGSLTYGMAKRVYGSLSYRKIRPWHEVVVATNTTLILTNAVLACDRLVMEPGARIEFVAEVSALEAKSVEIDSTARIVVTVNAAPTGDCALLTGAFAELAADVVSVTGVPASHTLQQIKGNYYLDDGQEPDHTGSGHTPTYWTGAVGSSYNDNGNWSGGTAPYNWNFASSGKYAMFDGFRNLDVVNNEKGHTWNNVSFARTAGPFTLSSKDSSKVFSSWGATPTFNAERATFGTRSCFPIKVTGKTSNYDGWCALIADARAYLEVSGVVECPEVGGGVKAGGLGIGGDVCVGDGAADTMQFSDHIYLTDFQAKDSRLTILPGKTFRFRKIGYNSVVKGGGSVNNGAFNVCSGAKLIIDSGLYYYGDANANVLQCNRVDGEMDILGTYCVRTVASFRGTGRVHVAEASSYELVATGETALAGGITFSVGAWQTGWGDAGRTQYAQRLAVSDGTATLTAQTPWTYGLPEGVATETTVDDRALRIARAGTLVIDSTAAPITFADPIRGEGKLVFAEGAQVRIGGALFASRPLGKPIELARVGTIEGEPVLPVGWKLTQVANADGTVSLFAKPTKGLAILLR